MKTKKQKTIQSRYIIFAITFVYNLIIGIYLKDFLVLSPTLITFYLLSILPTLFLLVEARSKGCRAVIYILLFVTMLANILLAFHCRRLLPLMMFVITAMEMLYLAMFGRSFRKDKLPTKIFTLIVSGLLVTTLCATYIFVCKCDNVPLANGQATLWDTEAERLADEICKDCETDEEKTQAFYEWIIHNFEYDYDCYPMFQYFNIRKTLSTRRGICFDFAHLFAAFCRSQNIPCYVVDGTSYNDSSVRHAWNRVYFNGSWWSVDVTNDIGATRKGKTLYGFRELESINSLDREYYIMKIY